MKLVNKKISRGINKIARHEGKVNTQMGKIVTTTGKVSGAIAPVVTLAGVATGNPVLTSAGAGMAASAPLLVAGGRVQKNYGRTLKGASKGKDVSGQGRKTVTGAFKLGQDVAVASA